MATNTTELQSQRDLASAYRQACDNLIDMLVDRKGTWRRIAEASGVPYDTLWKIADGGIANPTVDTLQKLIDYFANEPPEEVEIPTPPPKRKRPRKTKTSRSRH